MEKKLLLVSFIILFGFAPSICLAKYSGGNGSESNPYRISNAYDMNDIGLNQEDRASHFVLTNDIDLAQFTGTQFNIIAPGKSPSFTGVFDGNGFTISNFTYDSSGIFGRVGSYFDPNGEIKNLGLINPNVDGGRASLVSSLFGASITNCYAEGGSVSGGSTVGGLVGENREGTISNCYATVNVSVTGRYRYAGGLVGYIEEGTISNCYATGSVSGFDCIGGLVGYGGNISNCYATGAVVGDCFTGGLVGAGGNISNCYATGAVDGNDRTGGLVGYGGDISNCYATGNVNGNYRTGGLVGYNLFGTISDCNATGNVSGSADKTGGLVGYNDRGTIANCFTTGNVDGTSSVGGLIGEDESDSKTSNCYTTGNISGTGDYVGGLVGKWPGYFGLELFECYATGSVSGGNYVGGLAGGPADDFFYLGYISNCYSTGAVNGNDYTGGLVGLCSYISNSYATGNVDGNDYTGGLAGAFWALRYSFVSNCYATGDVNGNDYTGGLVGFGRGYYKNCYSTGDVNGNDYTGGLVGFGGDRYTKCFWDRDINPDVNGTGNITDPPDVIGETTENMQTLSTFTDAGWDFVGETDNGTEDIWKMCYDPDYPHLWWEQCPMPMHFTPRILNPKSKGKWVKAHFILPAGFAVGDVNTNSPARIVEPFMADSNYMDVFLNEDDLVEIEAAFDRSIFCSNGSMLEDIVVIARLTTGQYFYGTDTIRIKTNNLKYLAVLTSYWLAGDCGEPDWCAGADLDRSSVVDFIDFAFFDGCCLEFIKN